MKQRSLIIGAALLGACALPALAQQKPEAGAVVMAASAPGTGTIAATAKVSAVVTAIDAAQRQITVKDSKGKAKTLTAGPEVRNFEQIKVGDSVVVRYAESLTLTLKKDGKEMRSRTETTDGARAKAGEKPAGIVGRQVEITADVIATNAKTRTITLRGPSQVVDLKVHRDQFKLVKVGDQVQAVYTEAVAMSVEAAAPAKK